MWSLINNKFYCTAVNYLFYYEKSWLLTISYLADWSVCEWICQTIKSHRYIRIFNCTLGQVGLLKSIQFSLLIYLVTIKPSNRISMNCTNKQHETHSLKAVYQSRILSCVIMKFYCYIHCKSRRYCTSCECPDERERHNTFSIKVHACAVRWSCENIMNRPQEVYWYWWYPNRSTVHQIIS